MSLNVFMTMGAPFLDMHGVETDWIPMFMALPLVGGMLLQWPAGWCSDFIDRRLVTLYCTLIAGVAAEGIAYMSAEQYNYLLIAGVIFGAGSIPYIRFVLSVLQIAFWSQS
jgi:MFS family permease